MRRNFSLKLTEHEKWFPTRSDTNRSVQPQKMATSLKFGLKKKRDCTIHVAKTKALISCAVQGSHGQWKTWKTWKMAKNNSMHGKLMEFEKW